MADLPAHLQKSQLPRLSDRATEGMGSAMPPHVSIRGNAFTLVDSSGEETSIDTKHLDVAVIDMSDVMCKLYYGGKDWTPDSKDPPVCWSANGIAASREAAEPQNAQGGYMCNTCEWNRRGSAVSKLSGASIKACRDEKWLAVIVDGFKDMIFQLRITPGSFQNWKAYAEKFKNQKFDIRDVITRMQFEKDKNGVLTFQVPDWLPPHMTDLRDKLVTSKATDGIVGRLDQAVGQLGSNTVGMTSVAPAQAQQALPAADPAPTAKKRGRPPAQPAAAPENGQTTMAPFRPEAAPTFGIEQPAAPPAELANDLDAFFKS